MKLTGLLKIVVMMVALLGTATAQSTGIGVSIGGGLMELAHLGLHVNGDHWGTRVFVGQLPGQSSNRTTFSAGADVFYFYHDGTPAGKSRPWYLRGGLAYLEDQTTTVDDRYLFLNLRLGKQFLITEHLFVVMDAGALVKVKRSRTVSGDVLSIDPGFNISLPVFPAVSVSLGYGF